MIHVLLIFDHISTLLQMKSVFNFSQKCVSSVNNPIVYNVCDIPLMSMMSSTSSFVLIIDENEKNKTVYFVYIVFVFIF